MSFHFLHLTFQEYLAALYLVKQIADQTYLPTNKFELYLSNVGSGHNFLICRFICGIFLNEIDHENRYFAVLQPFIPRLNLVLCHCAFEAKSEVLFDIMAKSLECDHDCTHIHRFNAYSAYDCAAILYVIANMQKGNHVEINFGNSGVREYQIRMLANILSQRNGTLQVVALSLSSNKLTDKSVKALFHGSAIAFQLLRELILEGNDIGSDSITSLGEFTFNQLSYLTLSHCPIGVSGVQTLEDVVCSGC